LASSVPEDQRDKIVNPASMRQVLIEGSHVLQQTPIFEQGMGRLDLMESYALLNKYKPRASFLPPALDLTSCPYMWPFCTQSLYYSSMPVVFNVTILNGLGVTGRVVNTPRWISGASNLVDSVEMVQVSFRWSEILWPWTGWISIHLQASPKAAKWQGSIEGYVEVDIESPSEVNTDPITTTIKLPVKINVIPTPPKAKRVLWDQYHNMRYPPGYLPRDSLSAKVCVLTSYLLTLSDTSFLSTSHLIGTAITCTLTSNNCTTICAARAITSKCLVSRTRASTHPTMEPS
jgi:membrane-bound transcription factor site-1 protease